MHKGGSDDTEAHVRSGCWITGLCVDGMRRQPGRSRTVPTGTMPARSGCELQKFKMCRTRTVRRQCLWQCEPSEPAVPPGSSQLRELQGSPQPVLPSTEHSGRDRAVPILHTQGSNRLLYEVGAVAAQAGNTVAWQPARPFFLAQRTIGADCDVL